MTMTLHKISAGDGYDYLTRQVARGDQQKIAGQSLSDYYTMSGEPPGRWFGKGTDRLGVSGLVSEQQMQNLFGEGLDPTTGAKLGRAYPVYKGQGSTPYSRAYFNALTTFREQNGRGAGETERMAIRLTVARETLVQLGRTAEAKRPAAVRTFDAEQRRMGQQAVAGYDMTFSPAKSVSALWATGGREIRETVEAAHEAAWQSALGYVEKEAAFTRTGATGGRQIETLGITVAAFDHRSNRAGQPDFHTHACVSNKVQGVDGKWRALDGRALYAINVTASEMYNAVLEDELVSRLGVAFTDVARADGKRAVREIVGVNPDLCKAWSARRSEIEVRYAELLRAYVAEHGVDPSRAAQAGLSWAVTTNTALYQQATLETREAKAPGRPLAELVQQWAGEARAVLGEGGTERMLADVLGARHEWDPRTLEQVSADVLSVVSEQRSTWKPQHVRAEAVRQLRAHPLAAADRLATVADVERLVLAPGSSIRLTVDDDTPPAELQRSNGESQLRQHDQDLYTSQAVLDMESRLVAAGHQPTPYRVNVSPGMLDGLTAGQQELVRHFAGSGKRLAVGVGAAGVGKSHAMAALVRVWTATGAKVIAVAPRAIAAEELSEKIGAPADTVDRLLTRWEHGLLGRDEVGPGDMILVDEAGTASTRTMDRLRALAVERDAVLRPVGDHHQLRGVGASGQFGLLVRELSPPEMLEVLRLTDEGERVASLQMRVGDQASVDWYLANGRVHEGTSVGAADQLYQAWVTDKAAGLPTIMMARTNAAVAELNERAQLDARAAGTLTGQRLPVRDGQQVQVGETILSRKNDRRVTVGLGHVKNGDLFTVQKIGKDGSLRVRRVGGGKASGTIPAAYAAAWVDLGYASTIDRAIGVTVTTSHTLVDAQMTRQQAYTAANRGTDENHLFVAVEQALDVDVERAPEARSTGEAVLRGVVGHDGAELSATETMRSELAAPERLDRLVPDYLEGVDVMSAQQQADRREVLAAYFGEARTASLLAEEAGSSLLAELGRHRDPAAAVREAAELRDLSTAQSPAKVLTWRLAQLPSHETAEKSVAPLPWLPPVPSGAGRLRDWTMSRGRAIQARSAELAGRVDAERPPWAASLGQRPSEPEPARTWDRAATLAAAYREQWQVTGDSSVLGGARPSAGTQRRAWEAADGAVQAATTGRPMDPTVAERLQAGKIRAERLRAERAERQAGQQQEQVRASQDADLHHEAQAAHNGLHL